MQVSRVKRLPIPADSTQLLGKEFVGEEGRGANLIDIFGGAVEVRASRVACRPAQTTAAVRCLGPSAVWGGPPMVLAGRDGAGGAGEVGSLQVGTVPVVMRGWIP